MNLKFLLQPTIDKIRAEERKEGREEGREEEREKITKAMESWLEEQIRAGKVNEDVELPSFGGNGNGNHLSRDNGTEGE